MSKLVYRSLTDEDREWVSQFIIEHWGADVVVAHQTLFLPAQLPGIKVESEGQVVGLITFQVIGSSCEIITIDSLQTGQGTGSKLIEMVKEVAIRAGCHRLWLVTTNNNINAIRFYQKRGFRICAVHPDAVDYSRMIKPEIPLVDEKNGIPILDELELEMILTP